MKSGAINDFSFQIYTVACSAVLLVLFLTLRPVFRRILLSRIVPSARLGWFDLLGDLKNLARKRPLGDGYSTNVDFQQLLSAYTELFRKKMIYCLWVAYTPFILIVKAKAVEEMIGRTKALEKAWPYAWMHPWIGKGLLTSHGPKWKSRRKLLTPSFHFDILKDFLPVFNDQSKVLVSVFMKDIDKLWTDILTPVTLCTLDIICETTLGVSICAQKNSDSEYVKAVIRTSSSMMEKMSYPLYFVDWIFYSSKAGRQFKKDLKLLHGFTRSVIQEKKNRLVSGSEIVDHPTHKRKALMDLLLEHHLKNGTFTEEDIREEVDTFTFEGHDTTSMGVCWALYLIGLHQDVQTKIHEELGQIFGDDVDRPAGCDDLKHMKYLECALKEAQRLFPSVPIFGRQATQGFVLNGYSIPKGTACLVFAYGLHRDPDEFPDPEKFDPNRFLPENSLNRHPYAYVPFSAGPRNCIGQRFAMMEEKVIVSHILRNFTLESLDERDQIAPCAEIIMRSALPLRLKIRPRWAETETLAPH